MKDLLFSFFIFYSCIVISQNFEGTLTYKNDLVLSKKLVEKTGNLPKIEIIDTNL